MRVLSYILILGGLLLLAKAGFDQVRKVTSGPILVGIRSPTIVVPFERVEKNTNPTAFHDAMVIHWLIAAVTFVAGVILAVMIKGQERLDPLSPEFRAPEGLDEVEDALKEKEERQKAER